MIRPATHDDAPQLAAIYNYYVQNTVVTFEEESISDSTMYERITQGLLVGPWLVADFNGTLMGYSYFSSPLLWGLFVSRLPGKERPLVYRGKYVSAGTFCLFRPHEKFDMLDIESVNMDSQEIQSYWDQVFGLFK